MRRLPGRVPTINFIFGLREIIRLAGNAEPVTDDKFQSSRSSEPLEFLMKDPPM
jgi:hypothetical protein